MKGRLQHAVKMKDGRLFIGQRVQKTRNLSTIGGTLHFEIASLLVVERIEWLRDWRI